jgi:preprotein translocase subunit SecA
MLGIAKRFFGSANDRRIRSLNPKVERINALEAEYSKLPDEAIRGKTAEFRERLAKGEKLDDLLIEAFATVREAAKRALGQRHYDVQLIGGMVLHSGSIAEMRTGEGKTLVATLAAYLNALPGKGVHVITVNDYLASRDAEWMGKVYRFLGLEVGVIVHGLSDVERRAAYAADITYGTNNEFGFDYLRDNMKYRLEDMTQRGHVYAIVDEVDSILIDESRTPLIISGPTEDRSDLYRTVNAMIPALVPEDYEHDEKQRSVVYTESGMEKIEGLLLEAGLIEEGSSMYDINNVTLVHHANQALRAHKLFTRDKDYIVKDNEVMLIDEFTGRMMQGRRLSEGLHQAIEAKEGAQIQPENQTLASITYQNYFRLYKKLAGMTGTALTEAGEFADIYKLEVVDIPTHRPIKRLDLDDAFFRTDREKYRAIIKDIDDCKSRGQPVLVGTTSIEKSEVIAEQLKAAGFTAVDFSDPLAYRRLFDGDDGTKAERVFTVLNARYHEQEAQIIAQAGVPGAVTIATNMAGRGTDIQLGGNADMRIENELADLPEGPEREAAIKLILEQVEALRQRALAAGGLYVLGSERHESRRIDNQLRGRTGRQGDPGKSCFYVCLQDDLLRIFAAERMDAMLRRFGVQEDERIEHPFMNKALETSQKKVEQRNFEIRKNLLKYDDVINDQRKAIYEQRIDFMRAAEVGEVITDMRQEVIDALVSKTMPERAYAEQWDITHLNEELTNVFGLNLPVADWAAEEGIANAEMRERLVEAVDSAYAAKAASIGPERMRSIEKQILLQLLDQRWREHLSTLDQLRSVIHLRSYAQRDPLNEFKSEAFSLFEILLADLRTAVTRVLMRLQVQYEAPPAPQVPQGREIHADPRTGENEMAPPPPLPGTRGAAGNQGSAKGQTAADAAFDPNRPETWTRLPRNAACPCGSGKKYKHCHGAIPANR